MIAESFIHEEIAGCYCKCLGQCTLNVVKSFDYRLFGGCGDNALCLIKKKSKIIKIKELKTARITHFKLRLFRSSDI